MTKPNYKPSEADIQWARHHGWDWDGTGFAPASFIRVIPNPMSDDKDESTHGWCTWMAPTGACQMDAPFGSVRAALRVAEQMRQGRSFRRGEMSCAEDAP